MMFGRLACLLIACFLTACAAPRHGPYRPATEATRDAAESHRLNERAAELIDGDPEKAAKLLREALSADIFNGPAHNNLGVIHLSRGRLYDAASEFEWARKLIPGHPDPRLNLALALERGGRVDEALAAFDAALEVRPGHLPAIMALARAQLRFDRPDERTDDLLEQIALRGDDEWRRWALGQSARRASER
jgi:tetratricopeptide (TPR) repeat protein